MNDNQDTIFAPSSAVGGAIAVLRISGPEARRAETILSKPITAQPGRLLYVHAKEGEELLDDCMAVWFPAPHSYTGEDMVEINCHGGPQTVRRMLQALEDLGFRPAEGGEFTRRAFFNGKMDLTQAEAVMDLINATADRSRRTALSQLNGSVSRMIKEAEDYLLDALSGIDAALDYPEEAEQDAYRDLPIQISQAERCLDKLIAGGEKGIFLREGLKVCILGRPNVGKSSILNALIGQDRAIVTANAGTTRDILEECISIEGVPIRLVDTAGIREAKDEAEQIGIARAKTAAEMADLLLIVVDGSSRLSAEDEELIGLLRNKEGFVLLNKCDLGETVQIESGIRTSAKTGEGLDRVCGMIVEKTGMAENDSDMITNARHLHLLRAALSALKDAETETELDCIAIDLRDALHDLGMITGHDVDAEVIDRIFERFCVGK